MEYTEDDYLMISGIQHFKFCRRQWALIHVEQQWAENVHTAVGKLMHQKVHDPYLTEKRKDTILVRALPVSSRIMGVLLPWSVWGWILMWDIFIPKDQVEYHWLWI